jgi:hypothetical protein
MHSERGNYRFKLKMRTSGWRISTTTNRLSEDHCNKTFIQLDYVAVADPTEHASDGFLKPYDSVKVQL